MSPSPGLPSDLLARLAEILGIDEQEVEDAFAQAQSEMTGGTALPSPNQQ
jgi:energy-converting hydrogenase A subunit M